MGHPRSKHFLRAPSAGGRQLWHEKDKLNDQRAVRPRDLHISHVMFYALPPRVASPAQLHYTGGLYTAAGEKMTVEVLRPSGDAS
jgi:hypothetical protein